jgi:hypothetical protein
MFGTMATIKEAVQNAVAFAKETLGPGRTEGLQLEEVESTTVGGQDAWLITLSMVNPLDLRDAVLVIPPHARRDYKIFAVLKGTGEVTSMRIRELATT